MNYRTGRYGKPLSILGFGCMRFSQKRGRINTDETEREIVAAVCGGVQLHRVRQVREALPAGDCDPCAAPGCAQGAPNAPLPCHAQSGIVLRTFLKAKKAAPQLKGHGAVFSTGT